ncbi:MAG: DUF4126 domain-containing protein [Ferruginibacter sp.]
MQEILLSVCVGLGIASATGFRIFLPMLIGNVASLMGWYHFSDSFAWMGSWTAFGVLATATVAEITAYYIPFLDNLLDKVALPLAVGAGTLMSTSYMSDEIAAPLKWGLGLIAGGGAAGLIHSAMGLLRLGSSAGTAGTANPIVTTGENGAAATVSILAFVIPVVLAIAVIILLVFIIKKLWNYFGKKNKENYDDVA